MDNFIHQERQAQQNLLKKNNNVRNINCAKSQKLFYSANANKQKPVFIKEKNASLIYNKRPKRKYETFIIENSKDNSILNISNLFKEINETQKQLTKEKININKKNKTLLWYQILKSYDSFNKEEENNKNKNKNKKILNKDNKNINTIDEFIKELNKIHNAKKKDMNQKIEIRNYKDVINHLNKQIDMIKKERKRENYIFQKKLELIEGNSIYKNLNKYKTPQKQKNMINIYINNNKGNKYNKFNSDKNYIKNKSRFRSYNKSKKFNKNILPEEINYIMNQYNKSLNKKKKYLPKYLRNKFKEEKKNNNLNNNPKIQFYKKTMNEIKSLIKENELIKNRYRNISITKNEEINEIILNKINKSKIAKKINYKKNRFLIKKNTNAIIKKLIDELLLECAYDLNIIDKDKYENNDKNKLINEFNETKENLNLLTIKEQNLILQYDNLMKKEESKSYRNKVVLIPSEKKKKNVKINDSLVKKIENDKYKILENKLLNGCFYSDFNIFEIYDEFVEEQMKNVLDEEISYIINKYELFVEKLCNEEIQNVEKEINNNP